MQNLLLNLVLRLLRRLQGESKTKVLTALLEKIDAFPVYSAISFKGGVVQIRGKSLDGDSARSFHLAVSSLRENHARKLINEELRYKAITLGVNNGLNPEMIQFSKAVLYVIQEEEKLISEILDR